MKLEKKIYILVSNSCPFCITVMNLFKGRKDISFVTKLKFDQVTNLDGVAVSVPMPFIKTEDGNIIILSMDSILELEKNRWNK